MPGTLARAPRADVGRRGLSTPGSSWKALCLLRAVLTLAVLAFLVRRVADLGWSEVGHSLPRSASFYAISIAVYLLLPISEVINYQRILGTRLAPDFAAFVRKRVYNFAVFGYSGEAWFVLWLHRRLGLGNRAALTAVKDNNILSALVSNSVAAALGVALLLTGRLDSLVGAVPGAALDVTVCAISAFVVVPVLLRFHRSILTIPAATAVAVAGVHAARVIAVQALLVAQWRIALPGVPATTWMLLLAAQMLLTRIPFLPSQDLVVLGLGLSMAPSVAAPADAVAAMFVAAGAATQGLHLLAFLVTSFDRSASLDPRIGTDRDDAIDTNAPAPAR